MSLRMQPARDTRFRFASAQHTVTTPPVVSFRGILRADDRRKANSRATMAAWQVRPPLLVTMAPARFIIGFQSGLVVSVTSTAGLAASEILGCSG